MSSIATEIPATRARRLAGAGWPGVRERGALGARARLSPRRHRTGVRQRGERRAGDRRERDPAGGDLHHDEVLPAQQGPRGAKRSAASSGSRPTTSTCTSSTGRRAVRHGRGPGWSRRRPRDRPAGSGSRTSACPKSMSCSASPPSDRSSTRCSSVRSSIAGRCSRAAVSAASSSRRTARSAPAAI